MKIHLAIFITAACPLFAQNTALPIAAGYSEPAAFQAAPGQVLSLFLDDVSSNRAAQAGPGDLPKTLSGISVRITLPDGVELQAPIFAIEQKLPCGLSGLQVGDAGCLLTVVKLQIPFEMPGDLVLNQQNTYTLPLPAQISIDVDGKRGRGFPLQPLPDNSHILTTCDAAWDTSPSNFCDRQVFHADGLLVTANTPAHVGETLNVLMYGLGRTSPQVASGSPSPEGATVTDPIPNVPRVTLGLQANFLNAFSSTPRSTFNPATANTIPVAVAGASLVAGQIGLYKVSFTVPAPQDGVIPCGGDVKSNSILFASTSQGVESVAFCVQ